jgi:hypothetical protein
LSEAGRHADEGNATVVARPPAWGWVGAGVLLVAAGFGVAAVVQGSYAMLIIVAVTLLVAVFLGLHQVQTHVTLDRDVVTYRTPFETRRVPSDRLSLETSAWRAPVLRNPDGRDVALAPLWRTATGRPLVPAARDWAVQTGLPVSGPPDGSWRLHAGWVVLMGAFAVGHLVNLVRRFFA